MMNSIRSAGFQHDASAPAVSHTTGTITPPVNSASPGDCGPGLWLTDTEPGSVDTLKLRADRLARLRAMMRDKEYAALLLFDPNNQRYATRSRNIFGYFLRNSTRYFSAPT